MGVSPSMYEDGDIPRDDYSLFADSRGFAHYKAQFVGNCVGCNTPTNYWNVTIKSKGKYWCLSCEEDLKKKNREKLAKYSVGYGTRTTEYS